ncbi:MAG TPA: TRIC cation channel family protein, partial [Streptosporangiaceae bacterium]|nr:TRIC cation channel family protein [Streptosporangiaceae bacterium]
MASESPLLLGLDLGGTFAFALNGALTAVHAAKLDIVGVVTLGMVTALGGGILRDILIDALPPATFKDWRYLAVAAGGGLIAFLLSRRLDRLAGLITVLDAAGLSLFAVTGATKALDFGMGAGQAVILGAVTAVGGGTLRDVLIRQVPTVL